MGVLFSRVGRKPLIAVALSMAILGALVWIKLTTAASASDPRPTPDTVAVVNGEPLSRAIFDRAFLKIAEYNIRFGPGLPIERLWSYRLEALSQAVDEQLVRTEAREHDISVSDEEVTAGLDGMVNQYLAQLRGQGGDLEEKLGQACAGLGGPRQPTMTEAQFRPWLRDWLRPRYGEEVAVSLMTERLKAQVIPAPAVTEDDLREQFATVTLRSIAIRHTTGERLEEAEREAEERAKDLLRQLHEGADFAALATTASDDARYRDRGGLEGTMLVSHLNPDRQKAVFSLQVGEVSELIKTDSGYEILYVEARGYDLPPDYEETKSELRARLAAQRQEQAWQEHVSKLHEQATITVTDTELRAYTALREGKDDEGLALLEAASQYPDKIGPAGAASVFFQLGARYSVQQRWAEATQAYASCDRQLAPVLHLFPQARVAAQFGLGHTYENLAVQLREQGHLEEAEAASAQAVEHYQQVGRETSNPSHHDRLRLAYLRLGRSDLAEEEGAWLDQYRREMNKRRQERNARTPTQ